MMGLGEGQISAKPGGCLPEPDIAGYQGSRSDGSTMVVPENATPQGSDMLFDVAQMGLAVLDAHGVVTGWSSAAEQLVGYPEHEILNRPAITLLATREDGAALADQCRTQDAWDGAVTVRHRDGRPLTLTVRVFPLRDPAGTGRWAVLARHAQAPGMDLSRLMLEPLLTYAPVGVVVLDTDLRYVWVNDYLTYDGALPRERRLGRRMEDVLPIEHAKLVQVPLRRTLETGVPVLNFEFLATTPVDLDRQHAWWISCFRLEDSAGRVLGVWYMAVDNTERWRDRERLALLSEASAHIGSTLDVVRTAEELAEVSVPRFADVVAVDLLESVLRGEERLPGPVGGRPLLRRAAQQSIHAGCPETTAGVGDVIHRVPASPSGRCLSDGVPVVESLADVSASAWIAEDPNRADKVRAFGIHSVLVAPVQARGVRLGIATFARSQRPDPFDQEDVSLVEELLARAGVCVDNARRFTRERTAALTLQHSLLPRGLAAGTSLDVASRYFPADAPNSVGGDWFDVIPLSGARAALVVGDVVGRGMNAAATMGRLRAAVRTLADLDLPPDELLAHLDDLVISLVEQEDSDQSAEAEQEEVAPSVLGATCLYAVYDPVTRRCTMARAGHLPPAIVRADGTVTFPDLPAGPPLGLGILPFESTELELPDGALLAVFTNGLVQAGDRDIDVALTHLADALSRPAPTLENVCDNVIGTMLTGPPRDDAALLLARTHGLDARQVASWDLARDPVVVAGARDDAARKLAEWGLQELQFTTEMVVSELVTNAIRYGRDPIRLRLIRQRNDLICEVADGSSTSPRLRHARTTDEGGRGLFLVAQLSRRWGTRYTTTGKIIWAEQSNPDTSTDPIPEST
ncbi:PAS domain S-box-containing protein [Streptomyces sp. SAI-170]|uniref:SpoIIE family protein phosphatase n=1 Tax=Streptomyces sp. SAI-170 TaxID=3377729 RepID=UPI003C7D6269